MTVRRLAALTIVATALLALALTCVLSLIASAGVIHRRQWPLTEGV